MKIEMCINYLVFIPPKKVTLKFSFLQPKPAAIHPKNKAANWNEDKELFSDLISRPHISKSRLKWLQQQYLHHKVVLKGQSSTSGRWAVRNESFSPCAVCCQTRGGSKITLNVIFDQQDPTLGLDTKLGSNIRVPPT